ncbi:YwpF-like family protein [Metabacillus litoralis]|uniref:YwpF-like family protein n=1 Tax=Metabacillus litoralis TaxID=152268 RepID=UPI001CFCADD8|nr:YwpF-like family protein [Metabacillus litoralis]
MKTFKLVNLKMGQEGMNEEEASPKEIPLADGLIVNREDGENSWLIEALIPNEFQSYFQKLMEAETKEKVYVTISKKTNAPAQILARVKTIVPLDDHISILLDGRLLTSRPIHDPEELLQSLMEQGLTGDALMKEFKLNINQRKETTRL